MRKPSRNIQTKKYSHMHWENEKLKKYKSRHPVWCSVQRKKKKADRQASSGVTGEPFREADRILIVCFDLKQFLLDPFSARQSHQQHFSIWLLWTLSKVSLFCGMSSKSWGQNISETRHSLVKHAHTPLPPRSKHYHFPPNGSSTYTQLSYHWHFNGTQGKREEGSQGVGD